MPANWELKAWALGARAAWGRVSARTCVCSAQRSAGTFSSYYYYGGGFIAQISPLPPSLPSFFGGLEGSDVGEGGLQRGQVAGWLRHPSPCAALPSFGD